MPEARGLDNRGQIHVAGGVGQILVQLLRRQGARVFGTVSTAEKAVAVAALGAEPLLYREDLGEEICWSVSRLPWAGVAWTGSTTQTSITIARPGRLPAAARWAGPEHSAASASGKRPRDRQLQFPASSHSRNCPLARWFGVANSDLPLVLPNLGRFANPDLGFMG